MDHIIVLDLKQDLFNVLQEEATEENQTVEQCATDILEDYLSPDD